MKQIPLTRGYLAQVDDEDYDRIVRSGPWYADVRKHTVYARSWKFGKMSQFLMRPGKGQVVDHFDRDGLNNQKANLRICSTSQNNHNRKKRRDAIHSQYRGVSKSPREKG